VARIILAKARHRPTVLYYPPAGPDLIPVLRDVFILLATRPLFAHTVFHFHAGGVGELVSRLPSPLRFLAKRAYTGPDCAIVLSEDNYGDGERLGARHIVVVPNGIGEHRSAEHSKNRPSNKSPRMLYVGVLSEAKGIAALLESCRKLRDRGVSFELDLVGQFESASFEKTIRSFLEENRLGDRVHFHGVLVNDAKWDIYNQADLFCFPSFHETFGLVLVEAMQFALPVVAGNYPGVDRLVHDGTTGYTVSPNDADAMSERIGRLLTDAELRRQMGVKGRILYEKEYTLPVWYERMERALLTVSRPVD
jgi:glycosyltransferase involved in cell wall biosynthesis